MLQVNFIGFNSVSWIPGVYILYFTPLPPRGKKWQSADAQHTRKKENNKLNEEKEGKNKFCKIILAIYFMTYITADERGGITKNIQDYSWWREEQGKNMMWTVQMREEKFNIIPEVNNKNWKHKKKGEDKWCA